MRTRSASALFVSALAVLAVTTTSCPQTLEDVNVGEASSSGLDYSFVLWRGDFPDKIPAGSTATARVELLNNGLEPWDNATGPFFLSYHWKHPGGQFDREMFWGARTPLPSPVIPGQIVTVEMVIIAPETPKTYDLVVDVIRGDGYDEATCFWFESGGWHTFNSRVMVLAW